MRRSLVFWVIAVALTVSSAVYQRLTGPTYPISGSVVIDGREIRYRLDRSHGGTDGHLVRIVAPEPAVRGVVQWKRLKTEDPWSDIPMVRRGDTLTAMLPWQPSAGKLEYRVGLSSAGSSAAIPPEGPVVIRFKGEVPMGVLIPHILAMFTAMLFSTRAGLEALVERPRLTGLTFVTVIALAIGGGILGPIMQKYAFDAYWTGWPFGNDLTDNKTFVALAGWVAAAIALRRSPRPARWVLVASIVLFVVYLIPHSLLGSELDYKTLNTPSHVP